MLLVLPLVLFALTVPKTGRELPKPVVVTGVAPKGNLLSPNVAALPLFVAPNAKPPEFCPPKVLVDVDVEGKAVPPKNPGSAAVSVEPNKLVVVPPKVGVLTFCTFAAVLALGAPNVDAGVALVLVVSKVEAMVLLAGALATPNADAVVVCVVVANNGDTVLPNMPLPAVPKDVDGFVCPKMAGVPLPNTDDDAVVKFVLTLGPENILGLTGLSDEDA